jgi:hypothetical protein
MLITAISPSPFAAESRYKHLGSDSLRTRPQVQVCACSSKILPTGMKEYDYGTQHTRRGSNANEHNISNAVSLTTPAVVRFFPLLVTEFEHTSSSTHESRLSLSVPFICATLTCWSRLRSSTRCCPTTISSITIDHDELFELPIGRQVAYSIGR